MDETSEKLYRETLEKSERIGVLNERGRILDGLMKADLPAGLWLIIRKIICPE